MAPLRYTHAVVSRVPTSVQTLAQDVSLEKLRREHEGLVRLLRDLGLDVIELPPDEEQPSCVFAEDTAIVCNGSALIGRPGAPRNKEAETMRAVLKKELNLPIIEISDSSAKLECGDVLFTGQELFVGLSDFTNEAGARAVAGAFPDFPCSSIKVVEPGRKLKSYVSMAGPELMAVGSGKAAQEILKRMEREVTFSYNTLTVPEDEAANMIYLNGTLLHRSESEIPLSCKVIGEKISYTHKGVDFSEMSKVAASLSSCCLLLRRQKHIKSI